jgi:hypothetical protein
LVPLHYQAESLLQVPVMVRVKVMAQATVRLRRGLGWVQA